MSQEEFYELLKKYRQGECTREEIELIERFDANLIRHGKVDFSDQEKEKLEFEYISEMANYAKGGTGRQAGTVQLLPWRKLGVAASLIFLVSAALFVPGLLEGVEPSRLVSNDSISSDSVLLRNSTARVMQHTLPDLSVISLQPGARIRYSKTFQSAGNREVMLEGVAFFDVRRDEKKPFIVYTGEVVTQVLGTSFTIDAVPGARDVTVLVKTGKVSVFRKAEKDIGALSETILTPNQKAVFNQDEKTVDKLLVENPQPLISKEEVSKIRFEKATASEVFGALERVYGIEIVFDRTAFSNCLLKTSISEGELFNRLEIICNAIGATYKVEGTRIIVDGSGCN